MGMIGGLLPTGDHGELNGADYLTSLQGVTDSWNKSTNANLTPQQYYHMQNPNSYGDVFGAGGWANNATTSAAGMTGSPTAFDDQINGDYQKYLGRAPDASGFAYWKNQLASGMTSDQIAAAMQASPEYQSHVAAVNNGTTPGPQAPTVPATPAPAASTQATPGNWQVDPNTQTTAGQLPSILDPNSPLMVQARTQAAQDMNARGLLNSSLNTTAGESAMIAAAEPIAASTAQTYSNAASQNATAQTQTAISNAGNANQLALGQLDANTRVQLQNMQSDSAQKLATIQANYQSLMQTSSSATSAYNATINGITSIVNNANMDGTAKANAINGYTGWLQNQMEMLGSVSGVDLSPWLNFGTVSPT